MKKIVLTLALVLGFTFANAQDEMSSSATSKGSWLVEMNTAFGNAGVSLGSSTGIGWTTWESVVPETPAGVASYNIKNGLFNMGIEGGYFVADNFAIKGGIGYSNNFTEADLPGAEKYTYDGLSWMLGSKYYVSGQFPLQLALRGTNLAGTIGSVEDNNDDPLWLGFGAGYAWFLTDNIALEPGLAYNLSLSDYADGGAFEVKVGFAAFF